MITCKHVFIDKRITIYIKYYMYQKIITLANHKGGVGKSTSTASIGACMALMGKKVLLIDLDGQANLTLYFIPDEDSIEVSIFDSLVNGVPLPVVNVKENLDIVPSSLEMASAEISMTNLLAREQLLSRLLEPVKDKYDLSSFIGHRNNKCFPCSRCDLSAYDTRTPSAERYAYA